MKEKLQYRYKSTSLALKELNELGYTIDFNVVEISETACSSGKTLYPNINFICASMDEVPLSENEFDAAVFIGGMDGIEVEYKMFKEKHSKALILPIASAGAATKIVYETIFPEDEKHERFVKDYGYMSLFQKYLMDKI